MTVGDIITSANSGELKNISIEDSDILAHINLATLELYKRFPLKVEEHLITLVEGQSTYDLPTDCMWLVSAFGEIESGNETEVHQLPINNEDDIMSVNTISWDKIQVPAALDGEMVSLIYTAAPEWIAYDQSGVYKAETVNIPPQMIEPLLHYIGFRAHGAMNSDIQTENSSHYKRFEDSCAEIERRGMFTSDDLSMNDRITQRGLV